MDWTHNVQLNKCVTICLHLLIIQQCQPYQLSVVSAFLNAPSSVLKMVCTHSFKIGGGMVLFKD